MSQFSDAMTAWVDEQGLIGSCPNPGKWSSGNPLLETAIAITYEIKLNGRAADLVFLRRLIAGLTGCENANLTFNKNPGRTDQITHDDLIGVASTQRLANTHFARDIVIRGNEAGWNLSNTGAPYWDSLAKPWEVGFYKLAATVEPTFYELAALVGMILVEAGLGLVKRHNAGVNRLSWLMLEALRGANPWVDRAASLWRYVMNKCYANLGELMAAYYDTYNHPYVAYGYTLTF